LIALPVYVDVALLYYRKDLLERYGYKLPRTFAEFVECCIHIQREERKRRPNFYAFVWQGAQYEGLICNFLEFAHSAGGGISFDEKGIVLNTPQNLKALKFMRSLIHDYKICPPDTFTQMKEEEVRIHFQRGDALFERNWPYAWALHQAEDSKVKGKIGVAPLPHFEGKESASTLGGWHICMSRYSDAKELAWLFIKFVTSYDTQKRVALNLGWNPARVDVYKDAEVIERLPHLKTLQEVVKKALSRPPLPFYTQISDILQRYINAALAQKMSPQRALKRAEREVQLILKKYKGR
jgi:multiple sugar transport system substrate-binding protein